MATGSRCNRNHLRTAFNAVHVEASCCEEPAMTAGAGAELQDRAGAWCPMSDRSSNVIGLCRVVLVVIQQVIKCCILLEMRHGSVVQTLVHSATLLLRHRGGDLPDKPRLVQVSGVRALLDLNHFDFFEHLEPVSAFDKQNDVS